MTLVEYCRHSLEGIKDATISLVPESADEAHRQLAILQGQAFAYENILETALKGEFGEDHRTGT